MYTFINFKNLLSALIISIASTNIATASAPVVTVPNPSSSNEFSILIGKFFGVILSVSGSVALLILIAGGIMYITSAGNEQKVASSKKIITYTILGLMLVLAAYSISLVINNI